MLISKTLKSKFMTMKLINKFERFQSQMRKTKLIDQNWKEFIFSSSPNSNKKSFMDVSGNKKNLKLSEVENILKNKTLLDPFRSKKTVDLNLVEISEGKAKILLPENEEQSDPDAKFDLFSIYNIVTVTKLLLFKIFIKQPK